MIRSASALLASVLAAATLLLGAAPASAHTALKSSDPKKDAEIAPPSEITLTYNEVVRLPRVILTGPDDAHYEDGTAKASDNTVTLAVKDAIPNGTYTVGWRVVSSDGHPVSGTYKFTVTGAQPSNTATSSQAPPTTSPAASSESEGSSSGWLWIGLAALVIALIVGGVAWARRPTQE